MVGFTAEDGGGEEFGAFEDVGGEDFGEDGVGRRRKKTRGCGKFVWPRASWGAGVLRPYMRRLRRAW